MVKFGTVKNEFYLHLITAFNATGVQPIDGRLISACPTKFLSMPNNPKVVRP